MMMHQSHRRTLLSVSLCAVTHSNVDLIVNLYLSLRVYAILNDQGDQTLASPDLFDAMDITNSSESYTPISCAGSVTMFGGVLVGW